MMSKLYVQNFLLGTRRHEPFKACQYKLPDYFPKGIMLIHSHSVSANLHLLFQFHKVESFETLWLLLLSSLTPFSSSRSSFLALLFPSLLQFLSPWNHHHRTKPGCYLHKTITKGGRVTFLYGPGCKPLTDGTGIGENKLLMLSWNFTAGTQ